MKRCLLVLAACTAPVRPATTTTPRAATGMEWLEGHWQSAKLDSTWMTVGGVLWGVAKTLGAGALRWEPVASGARGDLGFTLGAATFTEPGGKPEKLTYCTIWKHEADGSWKVLFDIGRPVES